MVESVDPTTYGGQMDFVPLHYPDRLTIVNPQGNVGIVTLWSKVDAVMRVFREGGIDFSTSSPIAVVANLYGNGLPQMLRNLMYNPQITHLAVLGSNLSGSREHLRCFFSEGLEEIEFLGAQAFRIRGTDRIIDGLVKPEDFARIPEVRILGEKLSDPSLVDGVKDFLSQVSVEPPKEVERRDPPGIPVPSVTQYPTNPRAHIIVRPTPIEAWRELVFELYRFGYQTKVAKKTGIEERRELQNVHVVIENPIEESAETLAEVGFSLEKFKGYQQRMLDPTKPDEDLDYAYGWLMRTGMETESVDSVSIVAERLAKEGDSRHCYFTLWNNRKHLPSGKGCPCFVTGFFRRFESKLTFTANFRTHNAATAWPENVYGLMAIQKVVAERAGMEVGSLTVISHSISLDPAADLDRIERIVKDKKDDHVLDLSTGKKVMPTDPRGEFVVTWDRETWEIVAQHSIRGVPLGEYRGKDSEDVERQIARDCSVSLISHALYLGRMFARAEAEMKAAQKATLA